MKKSYHLLRLFIAIMCLAAGLPLAQAQNVVIEGDGTLSKTRMPLGPSSAVSTTSGYNYFATEFLINAQEIGRECDITSLQLRVDSLGTGGTKNRKIAIYLKECRAITLGGNFLAKSGATHVWSGSKNFTSTGSYTFSFSSPFHYSGKDQLLIIIYDSTNAQTAPIYFACEQSGHSHGFTNPAAQVHSSSPLTLNNYTSSSSPSVINPTFRPRVVLGTANNQPNRFIYTGNEWECVGFTNNLTPTAEGKQTYSQILFTAAELGSTTRKLTHLAIKMHFNSGVELGSTTVRIGNLYLADVSTNPSSSADLPILPESKLTKVFQGYYDFRNGWVEFEFDRPFLHDGSKNLVLVWDDNYGGVQNIAKPLSGPSTGTWRHQLWSHSGDISVGNPTGTTQHYSYTPLLRFEFDPDGNGEDCILPFYDNIGESLSSGVPFSFYEGNGYYQMIVPKEQLGGPKDFNSLAYRIQIHRYSGADSMPITIYMGESDRNTLSGSSFIPFNNFKEVFNGHLNCIKSGWNTAQFDSKFYYSGQGNLIITVFSQDSSNPIVTSLPSSININNMARHNCGPTVSTSAPGTAYWPIANSYPIMRLGYDNSSPLPNGLQADSKSTHSPAAPYWKQSKVQQIFKASEMNGEQVITGISFRLDSLTVNNRTWRISLGNTTKNSFTSATASQYVPFGDLTLVYDGPVNVTQTGWFTINFDRPYYYNGNSNLVLDIIDRTGSVNKCYFGTRTSNNMLLATLSDSYTVYNDGTTSGSGSPSLYSDRSLVRFHTTTQPIDAGSNYLSITDNSSSTSPSGFYPSNNFFRYSLTQQIYASSEMGESKRITSIAFYIDSVPNYERNLKVYLKNVSYNYFSNTNTTGTIYAGGTLVFNGWVRHQGKGWVTILLDQPFDYDGSKNLQVTIDDNTGVYYRNVYFKQIPTYNNLLGAQYYQSDNTNPSSSATSSSNQQGTRTSYRAAARFGYLPGPACDTTSATSGRDVPTNPYYKYSYTQEIFTADEMGNAPMNITGLRFKYLGSTTLSRKISVMLAEVPQSSFSSTSNWVDHSQFVTRWTGTISRSDTGWISLNFYNGYYYTGQNNLVIAILDSTGSYSGNQYFLCDTAWNNCSMFYRSDGTPFNPSSMANATGRTDMRTLFKFTTQRTYTVETQSSPANGGSSSGSGEYHLGDMYSLHASPNPGYVFQNWSNNYNSTTYTSANISIRMNMAHSVVWTANFAIGQYTITANASPTAGGTVTGGGSYSYGATVTLTATPNTGYHFVQWNDGNTSASRTITVTGNASYTAQFALNSYTITTVANPTAGGTVSGGGSYNHGATATLTATPNTGYHFTQWNGGNTSNPRTITVTGNATYTANFALNSYTLTVNATPSEGGSVTGGGTYTHGQSATLTATPNTGYHFVQWNDGNTSASRTVTVTGNATYTAQFALNSYTVTTVANPTAGGTVSGGGSYNHGATATLTATPNTGYHFTQWNGGNTSNPRTITVTGNASYTANFALNSYTLTVNATPSEGGSVTGGGTYTHGQSAILTATPSTGYHFVQWNDGNTNASRTVTVTGNASYTAQFALNSYTVTTVANPATGGTVTGGGTYTHGQTATLTATANNGYHFVQWNDGVTTASRSITVTANATYTATFELNPPSTYTITVVANPANGGTVSGGGTYTDGATATLTASANTGYHFTQWNDGNTNATRTITVTGNATYTATFVANSYTITTVANPTSGGTVTGGGSYTYGQTATLSATANTGYHFTQWSDGNTNASRTVTVTSNATYTANFAANTYTITTAANPTAGGTVTGGGSYTYGQTATLIASPATGYTFTSWNDGNTNASRTITVTANATYTATFTINSYTITVNASPAEGGSVTGGGSYNHGQSATLTATANTGYHFTQWSDGNTNATRTVTVTANATYTAQFSANSYTLTVNGTPSEGGTVTGGGTYTYGQSATLTATPATGYHFDGWQDGNSANPRSVIVTGNATYTASFVPNTYTITTLASPAAGGSVTGGGDYSYGITTTLTAVPATGYHFVQWNDGVTNASRSITVTADATYTATFEANPPSTYTITVVANPANGGTVTGGGTYTEGATATLTATANTGYTFSQWNDGNTNSTRTITVNGNATYTATFVGNTYTITTLANPSEGGTVTGGGTYTHGQSATLTATPNSGYSFSQWNDGNTDATRIITVTANATYTATFTANSYAVTLTAIPANGGSVSGAGTYTYGQSATLTATANNGYSFTQWSDGNTISPRTITVTSDVTLAANFSPNSYTLTVNGSPAAGGTVTGGGSYTYGQTATLTATPNPGYSFSQWNDGSTQATRNVIVTGDATFTATFTAINYTITVNASPATGGTVSGSGTYTYGQSVTLTATPSTGYSFSQWNDGNTNASRTITVSGDATYTATFTPNSYTLTTVASPIAGGTVSGGGSYTFGQTATLTAAPATGYHFSQWNDGNTNASRTVTVVSDTTFVATFVENAAGSYTLTVIANPANGGTVTGGGTYTQGSTATLTATANTGYTFSSWNDGNSDTSRTVTVTADATYTATFTANSYTITTAANPTEGGSVTGGGSYTYGATITLEATPNLGYSFTEWNDGNTDNPRSITVTGNASYTALFDHESYSVTTAANPAEGGSVSGGGSYTYGQTAILTAIPAAGYHFAQWNDGYTNNPRQFVVTENVHFTAMFEQNAANMYTITVLASPAEGGSVSGGGSYEAGTSITLSATANTGYTFTGWSDGESSDQRTITVTEDATFTALFQYNGSQDHYYTITVTCNPEQGTVIGGGTYLEGSEISIGAFPKSGFQFGSWDDGNTDNPRSLTVVSDATYTALFNTVGIDEVEGNEYTVSTRNRNDIVVHGAVNCDVVIYDAVGRELLRRNNNRSQEILFTAPSAGVYIVWFSDAPAKRVTIVRGY